MSYKINLEKIEQKLGLQFKDQRLLQTAFVHRSYLNERPGFDLPSNERLEFLGDAVLQLTVSEHLYQNFPNEPEGELTNYRASIVNAKTLSEVSAKLSLGEFLLLSRGEEASGGRRRPYLLANTFEALLGVIYLDLGLAAAQRFVGQHILPLLGTIIKEERYKDYKSKLQELAQEKLSITPIYKVLEEEGPDHAKHFRVGVFVNDRQVGIGDGSSKQVAEQEAARLAFDDKTWSEGA